jgi:bacteriocin biosynthesis cyclodehydratase domain-containing protein
MKIPYLMSRGEFGEATARYFTDLHERRVRSFGELHTIVDESPHVECLVVVLWRPYDELCAFLNSISYEYNIPFLPAVLDCTKIILGPLVLPGCGACWACWAKRSKQHDRWLRYRSIVREYYSANPGSGPKAYLDSAALMTAGFLSKAVTALRRGELGGVMWKIDPLLLSITTSRVVGVHGCPFCGLKRSAEARTFLDIQTSLAALWEG